MELVPAYLLLGEASIGLKQYAQAEEYLSLAKWSVLKSPGCENSVRAQLHRNFGLLYASQGRSEEAIQQLANDVCFCWLKVSGPCPFSTVVFARSFTSTHSLISNAPTFFFSPADLFLIFNSWT